MEKRLFAGKPTHWIIWYLSEERMVHYGINSDLCINTLKEKQNKMFEKLIHGLEMYANAIRNLLTNFSFVPSKIKKNLENAEKSIQITNLDYDIVIKRLQLYCDIN